MFLPLLLLATQAAAVVRLRYFHAAFDPSENPPAPPNSTVTLPGVAVFPHAVDSGLDTLWDSVSYKSYTAYIEVLAGTRQITVYRSTRDGPIVLQQSVDLVDGQSYTLLLRGQAGSFQLLTLTDDQTPVVAGQFRLRFVTAEFGTTQTLQVDVDGTEIYGGISYSGNPVVSGASVNVPADGSALFAVMRGLINVVEAEQAVLEGTAYTLWLLPPLYPGSIIPGLGDAVAFFTQDLTSATTRVRFVHAIPVLSPVVSVFLYNQRILSSVPYLAVAAYTPVLAERSLLKVVLEDGANTLLFSQEVEFAAPTDYTVVLLGNGGFIGSFAALTLADNVTSDVTIPDFPSPVPTSSATRVPPNPQPIPVPGNNVTLRFVHAASDTPSVPPVNVDVNGVQVFSSVTYARTTNRYLSVLPGQSTLSLYHTIRADTFLEATFVLEDTKTYTAVFLGTASNPAAPFQILGLIDAGEGGLLVPVITQSQTPSQSPLPTESPSPSQSGVPFKEEEDDSLSAPVIAGIVLGATAAVGCMLCGAQYVKRGRGYDAMN